MSTSHEPDWTRSPPAVFDIVACWFPDEGGGVGSKLRPCLVTAVLRSEQSRDYACRIAYGTTTLKIVQRSRLDLIIQDAIDLQQMGLARPTRFDLDKLVVLPWIDTFFGCWTGHRSPAIGALTESYIKEYAFLMMRRRFAEPN
jgi:hypothetical protein